MERTSSSTKYFILNYVFVGSLLLLFVNDHFLKAQFANGITGKLSDMAGIILLPLLLAFLLPRISRYTALISALLFIYWKSPLSQPLIDLYNEYAFIQTSRVVDYTDLYVLSLLPIPYFLIRKIDELGKWKIKKGIPLLLLIPTAITLMATAPPEKHYYTRTDGNLSCYGCNITVKYNQDEIIDKLKRHNIIFDKVWPLDTVTLNRFPHLKKENVNYYRLNSLIIDKDTLQNLDFTMKTNSRGKTRIYFNGMQVSQDLTDEKLSFKLRKYYKRLLFDELKQHIKK
jgi:hypothetical protein